jgi:hypothetical protein
MPPSTRSKAKAAPTILASIRQNARDSASLDSGTDTDTDSDDDDDRPDSHESEQSANIRSPTQLLYNLDQLSDVRKVAVRDTFSEPPKIALQRCRRIGNTYAFQMTELVTRSVRIRSSESTGPSSRLSCSCGPEDDTPCSHLLWLLDQVLKQTLYGRDGSRPLTMNKHGYADEMGDPFQKISDFHLDILADGLHCAVVNPNVFSDDGDELDSHRVMEARELLASLYSTPPEEFRADDFSHPKLDGHILRQNDLDSTVFRMLLDNHHFFQYFSALSRPTDPINDIFRKLSQRVDHILRELDSLPYFSSPAPPDEIGICDNGDPITPRDVPWAAKHLLGIVGLIRSSIYTRDRPLQHNEALSAARTLVHILASVVARNCDTDYGRNRSDRNLYLRLIGDTGQDGFVIAELDLLPEAAGHLVDGLEAILEQVELQGAPTAYVARLRNLVARLRTSSAGFGLKRHSSGYGSERNPKRMK